MEDNKVLEMENQVEVVEAPTEVAEVVEAPIEVVNETEKPAIPGVVLGAGVVIGGIALIKGVKAGIKAGRKAKQKVQEKLDNWHLERAKAILAANAENESEGPEESENVGSEETEE